MIDERDLRRRRFRALMAAPEQERDRVDDRFDALEADLLRDLERPAAPPPDLDAGRGTGTGAPAMPHRPTWANPGPTD